MDYLGLQKKYSKLPDSLKKAIFSVENAEKIQDIAKKYESQIRLYAEALSKGRGKPVKEAVLYLFSSDQAVRII